MRGTTGRGKDCTRCSGWVFELLRCQYGVPDCVLTPWKHRAVPAPFCMSRPNHLLAHTHVHGCQPRGHQQSEHVSQVYCALLSAKLSSHISLQRLPCSPDLLAGITTHQSAKQTHLTNLTMRTLTVLQVMGCEHMAALFHASSRVLVPV